MSPDLRPRGFAAPILAALALGFPSAALATPLHGLTPIGCLGNAAAGGCTTAVGQLDGATSIAVSQDGANAYVASVNANTLVTLSRDNSTGGLTPHGCVSNAAVTGCTQNAGRLSGAVSVAIDPAGGTVYLASVTSDTITAYARAADGTLTPAGCWSNASRAGCIVVPGLLDFVGSVTVSPDGKNVYAASLNSGAVVTFARDAATGSLTFTGCQTDAATTGCTTVPGQLDGASSVTVAAGGTAAYATAFGAGTLVGFARDPATGQLTARECFSNAALAGCTTLAGQLDSATSVSASRDGATVDVASPVAAAVSSFAVAPGTGLLTPQSCFSSAALAGCRVETGRLDGASATTTSPDGTGLLAASGDSGTVTSFARGDSGEPEQCFSTSTLAGCTTLAGHLADASAVAVSPDGANVYATSSGSDTVVSFARELPPQCRGTSSSGPADAAQVLTLDCRDPNGDALSFSVSRAPQHGTLDAIDPSARTVRYVPSAGFSGGDELGIVATSDGKSSEAAVTVTVTPAPPVVTPPTTPSAPTVTTAAAATPRPTTSPPAPLVAALRARFDKRRFTVRSTSRRLTLQYAANRQGRARLSFRRGGKAVVTLARRSGRSGKNAIVLGASTLKRLRPGTYVLRVDYTASTGKAVSRDDVQLVVRR